VSESDAGVSHDIVLPAGRQAYLLCIEGTLAVGTSDAGKCGLGAILMLLPLLMLMLGRHARACSRQGLPAQRPA
jgi:hypothetical protein